MTEKLDVGLRTPYKPSWRKQLVGFSQLYLEAIRSGCWDRQCHCIASSPKVFKRLKKGSGEKAWQGGKESSSWHTVRVLGKEAYVKSLTLFPFRKKKKKRGSLPESI